MRRTELKKWLKKRTQRSLSYLTGLTQPSISAMLNSNRRVFVIETDEGDVHLEEVKRLGS